MRRSWSWSGVTSLLTIALASAASAQDGTPPTLHAGALDDGHAIDGRLDEPAWAGAAATDAFVQTDPREGSAPSARTTVRVLAGAKALVIGIDCEQPPQTRIVSFSVRRDATLSSEDHVLIVLGPFADGRSGYVFAVNPSGARYDGLINPGGETSNTQWDGIWESATTRRGDGWSLEARIPLQTLGFKAGLHELGFDTGMSETPITPVITGDEEKTQAFARRLFEEGVFAQGIAFPTVARDRARVRTIVTATHTRDELQFALDVFAKVGKELGII